MNLALSGFSDASRPLPLIQDGARITKSAARHLWITAPASGEWMMFAFDRSALAVLAPLGLLVAAVLWSHQANQRPASRLAEGAQPPASQERDQTVAANFASR